MKLSEYLKEENKKINEKILKDEPEKYKNAITQHFDTQNSEIAIRRPQSTRIILCVILIVAIITAVLLFVFCPHKSKVYYRDNERLAEVDLSTVPENVLQHINTDNYLITSVQKTVDSPSGDILFYTFDIEQKSGVILGYIYIVTNTSYNFEFENGNETINSSIWNNFQVEYFYSRTTMNDLPMVVVSGGLTLESDCKVYFTYNDMDLDQEISPDEFLNSVLILE